MENDEYFSRKYVPPTTEILELPDDVYKYLKSSRCLSPKTVKKFRLGVNKFGNLCIPFYDENNILALIKFRSSTGGLITLRKGDELLEVKSFCEPKGRPVLLGSNLVSDFDKPLIICYGDYDAMSVYEAGFINGVSLPFGDRGLQWVEGQWSWLERFSSIVLIPDFDENSKTRKLFFQKFEELVVRLGKYRCFTVIEERMRGCKDVNELLVKHGKEAVKELISEVYPVPHDGLERLCDYKEPKFIEGFPTGWKDIDSATGGLAKGLLSVWSGDNNAGKTTTVLNVSGSAVRQKVKTFYWSGEQKPHRIRWWFEQILAGPKYVESNVSERTNRTYWFASPQYIKKIREWYGDYFWVYDKRGIDPEEFFSVAELAVRRHGVELIWVDNLMAFTGAEDDYYGAQGRFAESCKNFAEDWGVHVGLIAHNKKINEWRIATKDDVEGSKKVTNWADEVYQVNRVPKTFQKDDLEGVDSVISLCKNRESEMLVDVRMVFEHKSKRIVQLSQYEMIDNLMGWEDALEQQIINEGELEI